MAVWDQISGFTQEVQQEIIKRVNPDLENLGDLVDSAAEGAFGYRIVRNCPYDCSRIPAPLKDQIANMLRSFQSADVREAVDARIRHGSDNDGS